MKYIVLLSLLFLNSACLGMSWIKSLKKKVETTFVSTDAKSEKRATPVVQKENPCLSEKISALGESISQANAALQRERLTVYQNSQKQNVNGVLLPLFVAGIFKLYANQSHSHSDAYFNFNMASMFSLGLSAAFAYKFCTTPLPVQMLEHKK